MGDLKIIDLYYDDHKTNKTSFLNNTRSSLNISTDIKKVETSFEWLDLMEDTVKYIDNIFRNPNRFIINEEEIVKVELARRVTVESIRHLSKHTNLIQKIEDNGDVKPSKILNINKDESYDTYENRLIYTLVNNMANFVELKKKTLVNGSSYKDIKKAEYHAKSKVGKEQISMEFYYTSSLIDKEEEQGELSIEERVKRLEDDIKMLQSEETYKLLHKAHVAKVIPPIKKTNVILKNTNFQYAMKLWDYLQAHTDDDTKIVKSKKDYEDNGILKEYINNTFLMDYVAMNTLSNVKSKEDKDRAVEEITDNLIQRIVELNTDLDMEQLKKKIGDKIAITRYKREASLSEIENVFSTSIKAYLERIENIDLG